MLQRTAPEGARRPADEEPGARGFARPEVVPEQLTEGEAIAALQAGRPAGERLSVAVDGVRCPVVAAGEGAPVLFVHGLGHDMWDWAPAFARRPASMRFVALDLPGFGLSDKPERDYPLSLLADAVVEAARLCDRPPVVVGSSLGGHVAMLAWLASPEAFAGLSLVDPGGFVEAPAAVQQAARGYYSADAICARADVDVVGNSRRIFALPSDTCERLAARKLALHRSPLRRTYALPFARVVDDVFRHPVTRRMGELARARTQIVWGEADVVVPPAACEGAARALGARAHAFPHVGHTPHLEAPDRFLAVLLPFVEDCFRHDVSPRGGHDVPR